MPETLSALLVDEASHASRLKNKKAETLQMQVHQLLGGVRCSLHAGETPTTYCFLLLSGYKVRVVKDLEYR